MDVNKDSLTIKESALAVILAIISTYLMICTINGNTINTDIILESIKSIIIIVGV